MFDMGSPALYFIALLILAGQDVVIRTTAAFLKEVHAAMPSERDDQISQLPIQTANRPLPPKRTALKPDIDPEGVSSLRVLTVYVEDGTAE